MGVGDGGLQTKGGFKVAIMVEEDKNIAPDVGRRNRHGFH